MKTYKKGTYLKLSNRELEKRGEYCDTLAELELADNQSVHSTITKADEEKNKLYERDEK